MAKYYLHLVDGDDVICDPEGSDLPSIAAAREHALLSAREILAEAIKRKRSRCDRCAGHHVFDNQVIENLKIVGRQAVLVARNKGNAAKT